MALPRFLADFNAVLALIMAAALLVAAPAIGPFAAYIALIAGLLCLVNPASWPHLSEVLHHRTIQFFLLAYGLIALSLIYRATMGDSPSYVFDFLPLVFCIPAAIAFRRLWSPRWMDALFGLAFLGSIAALATTAYGAFVLHVPRPTAIELSPIHLSTLAVTIGFLAAGGFLSRPSAARSVFLLGPLMGFAAAMLTGTRAALPSTALLILLNVILLPWLFKVSARHVAIAVAVIAGVIAVMVLALVALDTEAGRALYGFGDAVRAALIEPSADSSMAYRVEQYRAFWPAFLEAPIFGQGWHNQLAAAYPFLSEFGQAGYDSEKWGYIHNEALSMTLGMGVFGLAGYVLIFLAPLIGLRQDRSLIARPARLYAVLTILVGIFAGGLTDVLFMVELPKTLLIILCTAFIFVSRAKPQDFDFRQT